MRGSNLLTTALTLIYVLNKSIASRLKKGQNSNNFKKKVCVKQQLFTMQVCSREQCSINHC